MIFDTYDTVYGIECFYANTASKHQNELFCSFFYLNMNKSSKDIWSHKKPFAHSSICSPWIVIHVTILLRMHIKTKVLNFYEGLFLEKTLFDRFWDVHVVLFYQGCWFHWLPLCYIVTNCVTCEMKHTRNIQNNVPTNQWSFTNIRSISNPRNSCRENSIIQCWCASTSS